MKKLALTLLALLLCVSASQAHSRGGYAGAFRAPVFGGYAGAYRATFFAPVYGQPLVYSQPYYAPLVYSQPYFAPAPYTAPGSVAITELPVATVNYLAGLESTTQVAYLRATYRLSESACLQLHERYFSRAGLLRESLHGRFPGAVTRQQLRLDRAARRLRR